MHYRDETVVDTKHSLLLMLGNRVVFGVDNAAVRYDVVEKVDAFFREQRYMYLMTTTMTLDDDRLLALPKVRKCSNVRARKRRRANETFG